MFIYCYFTMQSLFNFYKNWANNKIIKNYVKSYNRISFFFHTGNNSVFGTQSNIYGGVFLRKKLMAKSH